MDLPSTISELFELPGKEGAKLLDAAFTESLCKEQLRNRPGLELLQLLERPEPWTIDELAQFDDYHMPWFVKRQTSGPGSVRYVVYCNRATRRFGRPLTREEVLQLFEALPAKEKQFYYGILGGLSERIQVKRQKLRLNVWLPSCLTGTFSLSIPEEHACVHEQAVTLRFEDTVEVCYVSVLEPALDASELRGSAIATFMPIHYYLFSSTGQLLYANRQALRKLQFYGHSLETYTLSDLLDMPGSDQGHFAKAALDAIIEKQLAHHELTLCTRRSSGQIRHTLFEMWPARDPLDNMAPAMLVCAFNVTKVKESEVELQKLRAALQRQNADLRKDLQLVVDGKAGLMAERSKLQAKLEEALSLFSGPQTGLNSTSPLDRVVVMLDNLLKGSQPGTSEVLALRNSLLQCEDLRRPHNFQAQIESVAGLTEDAGRSLVTLLQDDKPMKRQMDRISSGAFQRAAIRRGRPERHSSSDADRAQGLGLGESPCSSKERCDSLGTPIVRAAIIPAVERLLMEASTSWSFNMLDLDRATDGHCLSCFAFFLFQQSMEARTMQADLLQLASFFQSIEAGYRDSNPYHNRLHAASVLHMVDLLARSPQGLMEQGIVEQCLLRSMYLAALCHDFDHPGVTNDYLVRTRNPLAILYNDTSPLENHHASASQKLWLSCLPDMEAGQDAGNAQVAVRSTFISLILGTDMKQHFSIMSRFQGAVQLGVFDRQASAPVASARAKEDGSPAKQDKSDPAEFSVDHRMLAMQIALKAADIGHLALPQHLHTMWVERLQQEFFAQGDKERDAGLDISPLMDRRKSGTVASSQVGFFEVVALPLLRAVAKLAPCGEHMLASATANYQYWKDNITPPGVTPGANSSPSEQEHKLQPTKPQ